MHRRLLIRRVIALAAWKLLAAAGSRSGRQVTESVFLSTFRISRGLSKSTAEPKAVNAWIREELQAHFRRRSHYHLYFELSMVTSAGVLWLTVGRLNFSSQ